MATESTLHDLTRRAATGRPLWYHLAMGLVIGAAVIVSALLPSDADGLPWTVAALCIVALDRLSLRFSASPIPGRLPRGSRLYVAAVGIPMAGIVIGVAVVVSRSDDLWLAAALAVLMFVMVAGFSWTLDRRLTEHTEHTGHASTGPAR
jgi:FtsH-binding integral membrane protein